MGTLAGGPAFGLGYGMKEVVGQREGNELRQIYKSLGLDIPASLPATRVGDYVKSTLEIRKENREQQKSELSMLNDSLDANKKMIEQTVLPEKVKADLLKAQNDAEKSLYEARTSQNEAKYAEAVTKSKLALQQSQIASNYAMVPYRQAMTTQAQTAGAIKPLSNEAASGLANALQGIDATANMYSLFGKGQSLYTDPNARMTYNRQRDAMNDIIRRMRTGAAINATEETFYLKQIPTAEDFALFPKQAQQKLDTFNKLMTDKVKAIDPSGVYVQNIRGQGLQQLSTPKLSQNQKVMTDKNGKRALVEVNQQGQPIRVIQELQ